MRGKETDVGKKQYDPEAAKAHVKEAQERLADAVDTLMTSEGWVRWLKQQSMFHTYSWGNAMLIAVQSPNATHVKGFRGWQDMGRQVRKGEKAIRILAPRPWTRVEEDDDGNEVASGGISFTTASIFDISQTDPIEGKKAFEPAPRPYLDLDESGDEETCSRVFGLLLGWISDKGVTVEIDDVQRFGGAKGAYIPIRNAIWLQERGCAPMLATFIHEVAHALTHATVNKEEGYAAGELVAESVSYIVMDWFGCEALEPASHYVSAWLQRDPKGFKKVMGVIASTAQELIGVIEGAMSAPSQEEEAAA